jgi:cupin superfamily acireductone dioxygenase involved in methionine salvage
MKILIEDTETSFDEIVDELKLSERYDIYSIIKALKKGILNNTIIQINNSECKTLYKGHGYKKR